MLALIFALIAAPQAREYDVAPAAPSLQPAGADTHTADNPRERATVEWVNVSGLKGDGKTTAEIYFFVIAPDGDCASDSSIYLSTSMGEFGELTQHGCGLYSVPYTPPSVSQYTEALVTISGLTDARDAIWQQQGLWLEPPVTPAFGRHAEEPQVTAKRKSRRGTQSPVVVLPTQTAAR
jgi:hypothetical protein